MQHAALRVRACVHACVGACVQVCVCVLHKKYLLRSMVGAGHPVWAVRVGVQCIPIHLQGPPIGGLGEAGGAADPAGVRKYINGKYMKVHKCQPLNTHTHKPCSHFRHAAYT